MFQWHIEATREIPPPIKNPYLCENLFSNIKKVKEEGLLNIATMSSGAWYRVLLENNITMHMDENNVRVF